LPIATLFERDQPREQLLTPELCRLYDGALAIPKMSNGRPYVIGNFVETIDGVTTFSIPGASSGKPISGGNAEDRFVMGLLRAVADAVLVGAGTIRGDPGRVRTPASACPDAQTYYAELRKKLEKPPLPLNVVLTASGKIDLDEPMFHTKGLRSIIITTEDGASWIALQHRSDFACVEVRSTGESGTTTPGAVLDILAQEFGVQLLLHEGGATVFGKFLAARAIDELFLTLAPQIAGRNHETRRPSLAGETLFLPQTAPWFTLRSVKRAEDHLFFRYVRV
jgi:riboflavin biosynthesis pyrimidine reductase